MGTVDHCIVRVQLFHGDRYEAEGLQVNATIVSQLQTIKLVDSLILLK